MKQEEERGRWRFGEAVVCQEEGELGVAQLGKRGRGGLWRRSRDGGSRAWTWWGWAFEKGSGD